MNIFRQNTDYAMRMMGNLAGQYGKEPVSVRSLAESEEVSYQFACKILQQLHGAGLVVSKMGPQGGYKLSHKPADISLLDIVGAMQDEVIINRCTDKKDHCPRQDDCPISNKLWTLQNNVEDYLASVTLKNVLEGAG